MSTQHGNEEIGAWLNRILREEYPFDSSGPYFDLVQRVQDRLQEARPVEERFSVQVPWIMDYTAFTAPGRYVYVSRGLLDVCPDDEMVALVVAHEIAHHDLGHIDFFPEWLVRLVGHEVAPFLAVLFKVLGGRLYGPERECDADKWGLELCLNAGYDPNLCLHLFDNMEKHALDMGDLDIVFGPAETDDELDEDAPLVTRLRIWLFQRSRGYLPIRDRRAALIKYLERSHP